MQPHSAPNRRPGYQTWFVYIQLRLTRDQRDVSRAGDKHSETWPDPCSHAYRSLTELKLYTVSLHFSAFNILFQWIGPPDGTFSFRSSWNINIGAKKEVICVNKCTFACRNAMIRILPRKVAVNMTVYTARNSRFTGDVRDYFTITATRRFIS